MGLTRCDGCHIRVHPSAEKGVREFFKEEIKKAHEEGWKEGYDAGFIDGLKK